MPRRRSSEMPMMSAKEKVLDSSPVAVDQVRVPSVRTPSTSKAMAWRVRSFVGIEGHEVQCSGRESDSLAKMITWDAMKGCLRCNEAPDRMVRESGARLCGDLMAS